MKQADLQTCVKCVMDTTDPDIFFDENGICNYCKNADIILNKPPFSLNKEKKKERLLSIVEKIKKEGAGKKYDCVIGVSGGVDSSYIAYKIKELGLRPLAVHLDNGWDSTLAVKNVKLLLGKLQIDLYTHVLDWDEFRNLQLAFLRSSTPDSEIPTDHAIVAVLYQTAKKNGLKYVILGNNQATELIHPKAWSHGHFDWKYISSINMLFGNSSLVNFPHFNLMQWLLKKYTSKIETLPILDYMDYNKTSAMKTLEEKFGWKYYGGKHYESVYTRFFQGYILPTKFGFDKRKAHLSSLILSGQTSRERALAELGQPAYDSDMLKQDTQYVIKKMGISEEEFIRIMNLPKKSFFDYPSYEKSWYFQAGKRSFLTIRALSRRLIWT